MTSLQDDTRDRQQQPQRSSTLEPGNSPSPLPPAHLPDVAPAEVSGNARSGRDPFSRGHPVSFRSPAGPSQGLSLGGSPNSREHMLPGGGGGLDDDSRSMERHTSRTSRASPPRPIFVPHAGDGSNAGHGIEAREPAVRVVDPEREEWAPKTIGARLKSTLDAAIKDRDKFKTSGASSTR
ncbi:hypothetical protein DL93DRAFT_1910585 [Clavulina sp. PMI_390]|nr:hypothetical protein DL93DRAFT_1910585 [Clavulina sp. PMI_390]